MRTEVLESVALLEVDLVAVPVVDSVPTRTVRMLWRRTMDDSPAIRHLREQLVRLVRHRGSLSTDPL